MNVVRCFLAVLLISASAAVAQAQSLKIADRQTSKSVTAQQLLADPEVRDVALASKTES